VTDYETDLTYLLVKAAHCQSRGYVSRRRSGQPTRYVARGEHGLRQLDGSMLRQPMSGFEVKAVIGRRPCDLCY
jgi:hypothetical protein